jgi:hypothetical protein
MSTSADGLLYRVFVDWSASNPSLDKTPQRMRKGSQYNNSGVLSNCITTPQQWRAVHLNHNTTAVACYQVASQYHNSGVQSI